MALLLAAVPVLSCTTFCLRGGGEVLFGKNYDWMIGDGMVSIRRPIRRAKRCVK